MSDNFFDDYGRQLRNKIAKYFCRCLDKSPDSSMAIEYLKKRDLYHRDIIEKFKIGWCPLDQKGIPEIKGVFNGRIMFPIIDESGDVVAFSGRLLKGKEDIESHELRWLHEEFPKTHFIYGMNAAIDSIISKDYVIIVEGAVDVLKCHLYGFDNTVGLLGTAFCEHTQYQLRSLTKNFVLMLDGDKGGRIASGKIKKRMKEQNTSINIRYGYDYNVIDLNLKCNGNGYDPDDFFSFYKDKGKQIIEKTIEKKLNIETEKIQCSQVGAI